MKLKSKLSLTGLNQKSKNFIEQFQKVVPLSSKITVDTPEIFDIERVKFRQFLDIVKNDSTKIGRAFQEELKKTKSLSFINDLANKPDDKYQLSLHNYYNREKEMNSKFEIKKQEATKDSKRAGLLGYKMGMTSAWDKYGTIFPLTVIKVDNCQVTQLKSISTDKYYAVQIGMGEIEPNKVKKPIAGHLIKNDIPPKRFLREFRVSPENLLPIGYMLSVRHFLPGQYVDVVSISKGKGYQGVMKRWNFKGLVASHGCSKKHRAAGSIGNREKPGKVWKGKKMPGRLGNERMTMQNLIIYKIDYEKSLLFIKGSVPGNKLQLIEIRDACKKYDQYKNLSYPTFIAEKDKLYPNVMIWENTQDMNEKYTHDNDEILGVSDEEEEGEPEKNADEEMMSKK